jgi:tetratricopeptide (TPR) repeat protein
MKPVHWLVALIVLLMVIFIGKGMVEKISWQTKGGSKLEAVFRHPPPSESQSRLAEAHHYYDSGLAAYRAGNYKAAVENFSETLRLDPSVAEAYHGRALAWGNMRQESAASQDFITAARLYTQQNRMREVDAVQRDIEILKASSIKNP